MGWLNVTFGWQRVCECVFSIKDRFFFRPFDLTEPNLTVMRGLHAHSAATGCLFTFTVSRPRSKGCIFGIRNSTKQLKTVTLSQLPTLVVCFPWPNHSLPDDLRGDRSIKDSTSAPSTNLNINISLFNMQTRPDLVTLQSERQSSSSVKMLP